MNTILSLQNVTQILIIAFLILLCYLMVELIRIAVNLRHVAERIETASDVGRWFHLVTGWLKKKRPE